MSELVYLFRASEAAQAEAMGTPERADGYFASRDGGLDWVARSSSEAAGH